MVSKGLKANKVHVKCIIWSSSAYSEQFTSWKHTFRQDCLCHNGHPVRLLFLCHFLPSLPSFLSLLICLVRIQAEMPLKKESKCLKQIMFDIVLNLANCKESFLSSHPHLLFLRELHARVEKKKRKKMLSPSIFVPAINFTLFFPLHVIYFLLLLSSSSPQNNKDLI